MAGIAFNLTWNVKKWFFNSPRVMAAMDDVARDALSHCGASVRQTAQRSMRYRSPKSINYAASGDPPKAVSNHPYLRKFIEYAWDPATKSVVVGPILLSGRRAGYDVGPLHEFGDTVTVENPRRRPMKVGDVRPIRLIERAPRHRKGGSAPAFARVSPGRMGRVAAAGKTVPVALARLRTAGQVAKAERLAEALYGPARYQAKYAKRPFMGPALAKMSPRFAGFFAQAARAARSAGA